MRRFVLGFLVIAALVAGGSVIANAAYQAGLTTAVTTVAATAPDGSIVVPVAPGAHAAYGLGYGHGYGYGPFGHGFSIFGFLGTLFVIILIVGLIRAIAFGGRHRGGHGWGPGRGGSDWGGPPWQREARSTFDTWHRESHADSGAAGGTGAGNSPGN